MKLLGPIFSQPPFDDQEGKRYLDHEIAVLLPSWIDAVNAGQDQPFFPGVSSMTAKVLYRHRTDLNEITGHGLPLDAFKKQGHGTRRPRSVRKGDKADHGSAENDTNPLMLQSSLFMQRSQNLFLFYTVHAFRQ